MTTGLRHYLLISPEESLARTMMPVMLRVGDSLDCAANPFDAVPMMREGKLDAILLALDDSGDAAVACRTIRRYSRAPIVLLVSPSARPQVLRGYRLGADAHVDIPCDPREFHARLTAVLRRSTLSQS